MANWYFEEDGQAIGPYSPLGMRELVADGTIQPITHVRREEGAWHSAEDIPGLIEEIPYQESRTNAAPGLIPYHNSQALIAYYLAIFSLIPCFGFPLGIAAVVLGIMGLKKSRKNPEVKGAAHAYVGIILGGLMALIWGILIGIFVAAGVAQGVQ